MKRQRRQLASSTQEHAARMKAATLAVQNLSRAATATAKAGQCDAAFEHFASLAYWTGVLEAEEIGADRRGQAFDRGLFRRFSQAKQTVYARCVAPAPAPSRSRR